MAVAVKDVDTYIALQPEKVTELLETLRQKAKSPLLSWFFQGSGLTSPTFHNLSNFLL